MNSVIQVYNARSELVDYLSEYFEVKIITWFSELDKNIPVVINSPSAMIEHYHSTTKKADIRPLRNFLNGFNSTVVFFTANPKKTAKCLAVLKKQHDMHVVDCLDHAEILKILKAGAMEFTAWLDD